LTASTGVAGMNCGGQTLDSLINCVRNIPLKGEKLKMLQEKMATVKYLIIDEISMIGSQKFSRLDKRLRQVYPEKMDEPFGGLSLIIVGDFGQLEPIDKNPIWYEQMEEERNKGFTLYKLFKTVAFLDLVKRQKNLEFRDLLMRIRNGQITKQDWNKLQTRDINLVKKPSNLDEIIHLFTGNKERREHNKKCLKTLQSKGKPVAKIVAEHYGKKSAMRAKPSKCWNLEPVLYMAPGAKVMCRLNLLPAQAGLVNGSIGTIVDIIYNDNKDCNQLPKTIIVDFPDYKGPQFFKNHKTYVPIVPMTANPGGEFQRTQFPLVLAYGQWSDYLEKSRTYIQTSCN